MYPNPTSDLLYIDYECSDCTYEIVDAVGRVLQRSIYQEQMIDLTDLPASTYHILLYDHDDNLVGRSAVVKR